MASYLQSHDLKRLVWPAGNFAASSSASGVSREAFWRSLQTFAVTRVVISLVLLIYVSFSGKKAFLEPDRFGDLAAGLGYLMLALGFFILVLYWRRRFLLQLLSQILVDISVISLLYVSAGGAKSGLAILYLFPLAGCAILAPLVWALFFVSLVSLILLGESAYQLARDMPEVSISHAGLYGAAFFAAALVINRLAAKLIRQEALAARRGEDLQLQQAINRMVIADMGDGILVVSSEGIILTANPAAERMLGMSFADAEMRFKLTDIAPLMPVAQAFFAWLPQSVTPRAESGLVEGPAVFVMIKPPEEAISYAGSAMRGLRHDLAAHLKLRFAKVYAEGRVTDRTVIFLQDVTEIENQAQQLKLASMGRLTASIAHEVRNPLSSISYAAALLGEEQTNPAQARLLAIVGDNVKRLNCMIEDILKLSRKAQPQAAPLALEDFFAETLSEFRETHGLAADLMRIGSMANLHVWFDPLHLREVVFNLLANALRYASGSPDSIRVYAMPDGAGRLELHVQDDGAPITPQVRAHLFEPFYTTSSKGTGLGLYLARELCINNGAMLDYEYHAGDGGAEPAGGRFVITMAIAHPH
ncbi:ATP-binding protein [Janthinobacterium sp. 17J80-10]|uniref:sensor histidine kinase n=1 Tax=Janthinobacterium sp. 17J80-10 TaxID=2497863 RepID=UPI001F508870|nr:ATP-binding protein [Janthinobacterium sp. 17J80-10]